MKYIWTIVDKDTKKVLALYSIKEVAEKMKAPVAQKFNTEVDVEKRTLDLELNLLGVRQ